VPTRLEIKLKFERLHVRRLFGSAQYLFAPANGQDRRVPEPASDSTAHLSTDFDLHRWVACPPGESRGFSDDLARNQGILVK
jgi:hypothetical protein